ncbi:MAG: penicillin-binding transpeptidase domain-containing protein [Bdellovibrionota bacterium]
MNKFKPVLWLSGCAALLAVFATGILLTPGKSKPKTAIRKLANGTVFHQQMERSEISKILGDMRLTSNQLKLDYFPVTKGDKNYRVHFTLDADLQAKIEDVYQRYSPDYAAFVALDPETGKILAMVDYSSQGHEGNLALKATFPAASVFKIVTSAAALDQGKIRPNALFPVNGRYGTLYKGNLRDYVNRWTRFITIEEAFAKSVNTVFGKIAMTRVGPSVLQKYANGFGFNQKIDFEMPLEMGQALVPTDDDFGLAEAGSGYTQRQTMNPVQGALMAASVINGGRMVVPHVVESMTTDDGTKVYEMEEGGMLFHPMDQDTAKSLSMIMENTITRGTARKEYRDYNHHPVLSKLFIGAKTGSLTGTTPAGRYDWFVGFAQSSSNPKKKIAFASMIINRKYWKVKSSHIAREAIIEHFQKVLDRDI